jgi:hypothetical protein
MGRNERKRRVSASRIRELNKFRKLGSSSCLGIRDCAETGGQEKFRLVLAKHQGSNYRDAEKKKNKIQTLAY